MAGSAPRCVPSALLKRLFTSRAGFDPATERRAFTLLASDNAIAVFGADLARAVHARAPGVQLHFGHVGLPIVQDPDTALGAVDGVLMPHGVISGFPTVELFRDAWVCLVSADHPEIGDDGVTLDDLARLPWAVYRRTFDTPATRQLAALGLEPRVEVTVQSFQHLPALVAGTRRGALMQHRLARQIRRLAPVRVLPCPFEAVPVEEALWWHPVHTQDAAHIWLRELAAEVAAAMASMDGG
ncbi:LysR substrate-binding domain-containing protein [Spirillospora sp. CA-255316]